MELKLGLIPNEAVLTISSHANNRLKSKTGEMLNEQFQTEFVPLWAETMTNYSSHLHYVQI